MLRAMVILCGAVTLRGVTRCCAKVMAKTVGHARSVNGAPASLVPILR